MNSGYKQVFLSLIFTLCIWVSPKILLGQNLEEKYIEKWKQFYPTNATRQGMRPSVFNYEDRSLGTIESWINFNHEVLQEVSTDLTSEAASRKINARLIRVQAQSEIDQWNKLKIHENQLRLYLQLVANAIPSVIDADYLNSPDKTLLINTRLESIHNLCLSAIANLKSTSQRDLDNSKKQFSDMSEYLNNLPKVLKENGIVTAVNFETKLDEANSSLEKLKSHVDNFLAKSLVEVNEILGPDEYARQLALYTDSDLTPDGLAEIAMQEIQKVRDLMAEVSSSYLKETYPQESLPASEEEQIQKALSDMEKDAPVSARDYENFWNELAARAVDFIEEKELATLPDNQTLSIQSAPESAGPAARIGWVASAPPFDPNPWTTLNLPSIPDTLPKQEQIDFWASFNKPFNRIIVIHELFPGHYMQLKISRETAHPVRLLFPYGIFVEGWATFCERVALDYGWEAENKLTLLAHLRKRIENANRAYTSVQVHCKGWTQDEVMKFSTETSLVAPQFAKSLWFRLMRSPMQLTSYFLGGSQFSDLLESEKKRLGDRFSIKLFMDTIMKAGPIPIDEFYPLFAQTIPD